MLGTALGSLPEQDIHEFTRDSHFREAFSEGNRDKKDLLAVTRDPIKTAHS